MLFCVFVAGRGAGDRLMGPREIGSRLRMLQLVEGDAWDAPGMHAVMRAALREGLGLYIFIKNIIIYYYCFFLLKSIFIIVC